MAGMNEVSADPKRRRARFQKFCCRLEINSTCWNERNVGQWPLQRLDVLRSAHISSWENFDEVGASLPSCDDFGGSQRAGHNQTTLCRRERHGLGVESRANQKLRTGV